MVSQNASSIFRLWENTTVGALKHFIGSRQHKLRVNKKIQKRWNVFWIKLSTQRDQNCTVNLSAPQHSCAKMKLLYSPKLN